MPEKIILEDGSEREVLTEEEQKNLQAGHDANLEKRQIVEDHKKFVESLELEEGQTVEEKIQELKEAENPDWKKMRTTLKTFKGIAKGKGIEFDDEGNIVEKKEGLTKEDVEKITDEKISGAEKKSLKVKALIGFDKKDAETIGDVFDKLDKLGGTFEENMELAIDKVLPGQGANALKIAINAPGGGQPRQSKVGEASPDLKSFGASAFGLTDKDFENAK